MGAPAGRVGGRRGPHRGRGARCPQPRPSDTGGSMSDDLDAVFEATASQAVSVNGDTHAAYVTGAPILDPVALYGVLGDVVVTIRPHTEACDAALLVTLAV